MKVDKEEGKKRGMEGNAKRRKNEDKKEEE